MKKTYIAPQVSVNEFKLEGLIAASLKIVNDEGKTVDTSTEGNQLSNKYSSPWSSTNWEN
ncbi:MAG: hypothetical protein IKT82_01435 [Bacteroidaceae bacterium]|nr:hypothetical protein [Bacteroidaceae bacterium]